MDKIDMDDLIKCYESNPDFKSYVDKCVQTYGHDIDYVLHQPITQEYYMYLNKIGAYDETKSHY